MFSSPNVKVTKICKKSEVYFFSTDERFQKRQTAGYTKPLANIGAAPYTTILSTLQLHYIAYLRQGMV